MQSLLDIGAHLQLVCH